MSSGVVPQEPRADEHRIISPFVELSQQMQETQPGVRHPQPIALTSRSASSAAWTPYKLPEARALLAVYRAAALRLRQIAASESASGLISALRRAAAPQARLFREHLAAVNAACIDIWPDHWVRSRHVQLALRSFPQLSSSPQPVPPCIL